MIAIKMRRTIPTMIIDIYIYMCIYVYTTHLCIFKETYLYLYLYLYLHLTLTPSVCIIIYISKRIAIDLMVRSRTPMSCANQCRFLYSRRPDMKTGHCYTLCHDTICGVLLFCATPETKARADNHGHKLLLFGSLFNQRSPRDLHSEQSDVSMRMFLCTYCVDASRHVDFL